MCNGINHNLKEVFRVSNSVGDTVINWCQECGSVVGDTEYDGRVRPGGAFKMLFPKTQESLSAADFKPDELPNVFSNLEICSHLTDSFQMIFKVLDECGNQTATIQYFKRERQWNIYVDNFPSSKKEYSTTLPFVTNAQFKSDIERTGLKLILKIN